MFASPLVMVSLDMKEILRSLYYHHISLLIHNNRWIYVWHSRDKMLPFRQSVHVVTTTFCISISFISQPLNSKAQIEWAKSLSLVLVKFLVCWIWLYNVINSRFVFWLIKWKRCEGTNIQSSTTESHERLSVKGISIHISIIYHHWIINLFYGYSCASQSLNHHVFMVFISWPFLLTSFSIIFASWCVLVGRWLGSISLREPEKYVYNRQTLAFS